jgi:hypothetical protein
MRPSPLIAHLAGVLSLGLGLTPMAAPADDSPLSRDILGLLGQLGISVPVNPGGYGQTAVPYPGYGQTTVPYPGLSGGYGQTAVPYPGYGQNQVPYPVNPGGYGQNPVPYPVNPGGYSGYSSNYGYGQNAIPYPTNPGGYSSNYGYGQNAIPYPVNPDGYGQTSIPYPVNPGGYGQTSIPYPVNPGILPVQPPNPYPNPSILPVPGPRLTLIVALSDQLMAQADAFLRAFGPTARIVPEGGQFISDALAVRNAAGRLRQAASSAAPPGVLAAAFQEVQAGWQRMDARLFRISKGNIGPNIAKALEMGRTVEQIRSSY